MADARPTRERILEVAEDLFYREGVRAVGIDTIIARSGVAKMSLYRNFASKDDLIVAYLEGRNRRFFARWDRAVGAEDADPRARLEGLVAATVARVREPDYRGCPFLNASSEFPDPAHPARRVIEAHRREVRDRLLTICRALGVRPAESLATQLIVLMDGAYCSAGRLGDEEAEALVAAAGALIAAQAGDARRPMGKGGGACGGLAQ